MPIQDVALNTFRERWTIETGGERGSRRSVLAAHDDDDDERFDIRILIKVPERFGQLYVIEKMLMYLNIHS